MKKYIYIAALLSIWNVFPQDLSVGYIANDLVQRPMQPLANPAYLDFVTDPSFPGTSIRRISEADPGASIVPMYSTIQSWNADESLLLVYAVGSGHRLLNGTDYNVVRDLSDIRPDDIEAVFWHFTDPDILFYMDRNTDDLIRYNVNTQSKTVIANMRAVSGCGASSSLTSGNDVQMMSWDSDVFAFRCGNTNAFYYRISTGVLTDFNITDINYTAPMPFPSGNLFYHNKSVYDAHGNFVRDLKIDKGEHSCLGKLSNGDDAYFAIAFAQGPDGGCLGTLVAHNATTGNCFSVTPTEDYGYSKSGTHISALAHKNSEGGWVAVSSMGYEKDGVKILDQELFIAHVNEFDGDVYRVAHHRSDEDDNDYWGEPHVTISPSGTRLLFGSDWSGLEDGISVDTYVAELSAYTPPTDVEEEEDEEEEVEDTDEDEGENDGDEETEDEGEDEEVEDTDVDEGENDGDDDTEDEGEDEEVEDNDEDEGENDGDEEAEVEEVEDTDEDEGENDGDEEAEEEQVEDTGEDEGENDGDEEAEEEQVEDTDEDEGENDGDEETEEEQVEDTGEDEIENDGDEEAEVEEEEDTDEDGNENDGDEETEEEGENEDDGEVEETEEVEDEDDNDGSEETEDEDTEVDEGENDEDEETEEDGNVINVLEEDNERINAEIILYPNPTTEILIIASDFEAKEIVIFNLLGKTLLTSETGDIDVSSLSPGLYLLQFKENERLIERKFIKR